ncbi:MAG: ATP synthase subunit C, partial [Candidatus Brocadiaceae bacterium]
MNVRRKYIGQVLVLTLLLAAFCGTTGMGAAVAFGQETPQETAQVTSQQTTATRWDIATAVAVAISLPCLAAGYAVGKVGAAALGAASEKPELLTRSLLFVALAEG